MWYWFNSVAKGYSLFLALFKLSYSSINIHLHEKNIQFYVFAMKIKR
jgi:hypothetical protein